MKNLLAVMVCLLSTVVSFSQAPSFPTNTYQSNPANMTNVKGGLTSDGYRLKWFSDTTAANAAPYIKFTPNIMIKAGENVWIRNIDATRWLLVNGAYSVTYTGVDSVTFSGPVLCAWSGGLSTCWTVALPDTNRTSVDSVVLIGNQLCVTASGATVCYTINNSIINNYDIINLIDSSITNSQYIINLIDSSIQVNNNNYISYLIDSSIQNSQYITNYIDSSIANNSFITNYIDSSIQNNAYIQYLIDSSISNSSFITNYIDSSITNNEFITNYIDSSIANSFYLQYLIDSSINNSTYITNFVDSSIRNSTYITNLIDSSIRINNINNFGTDSTTRLISGSIIHDTLMDFQNTSLVYQINGRTFTAQPGNFTITASHPTQDRYTVVYADTLGNVSTIDGGYNPADIPQVNSQSQILLAIYSIPAGSTTPAGISGEDIYKEAIEWQNLRGTVTGGYDSAYTVNPYAGLRSLRIPQVTNNQYFEFLGGASGGYTAGNYTYLTFEIRQASTFSPNTKLNFAWYLDNSLVTTNTVTLSSGQFGWSRTIFGQYQLVGIPMSAFTFVGQQFNKLRITLSGSNGSGFQLDQVKLQSGGTNTNVTGGVVTFNTRNGNVFSIRSDYNNFYPDAGRLNTDSSLYLFKGRNDSTLFTLPSLLEYTEPGYLIDIDSIAPRTKRVSVDSTALAALINAGGGGGTDSAVHYTIEQGVDSSYALFRKRNGDADTLFLYSNDEAGSGGVDSNAHYTIEQGADSSIALFRKLNGNTDTLRLYSNTAGSQIDTTSLSNRINLKADKATTITINGVTQSLAANRTWTITPGNDTAYVAMGVAGDSSYVLMYHSNRAITPDTLRAFGVVTMDTTTQTLTDGATITFNAANGRSARVTLGGNRTLAFTNFSNGMFLSLLVIQDATGSRTLALPASTRVIAGGAGAVTLTTTAAAHDVLTFWKINNILYCNYGKNYN